MPMSSHRPVVLVTGFGPFPGAPVNASSELAHALARVATGSLPGYRVEAATLPTEWQSGPRALAALLDKHDPIVAVHFGVSRRAKGFVIEQRAVNATGAVCDAVNALPLDPCVTPDGPDTLAATLPTAMIIARLRGLGLPVQASRDAGTYLCNAVLYNSLADARRPSDGRTNSRRGFVHLPDRLLPGERRGARRAVPSDLDWSGAIEGGLAILACCVGYNGRVSIRPQASGPDQR